MPYPSAPIHAALTAYDNAKGKWRRFIGDSSDVTKLKAILTPVTPHLTTIQLLTLLEFAFARRTQKNTHHHSNAIVAVIVATIFPNTLNIPPQIKCMFNHHLLNEAHLEFILTSLDNPEKKYIFEIARRIFKQNQLSNEMIDLLKVLDKNNFLNCIQPSSRMVEQLVYLAPFAAELEKFRPGCLAFSDIVTLVHTGQKELLKKNNDMPAYRAAMLPHIQQLQSSPRRVDMNRVLYPIRHHSSDSSLCYSDFFNDEKQTGSPKNSRNPHTHHLFKTKSISSPKVPSQSPPVSNHTLEKSKSLR